MQRDGDGRLDVDQREERRAGLVHPHRERADEDVVRVDVRREPVLDEGALCYGLWFMVQDSGFIFYGSWFMVHGSWLRVYGLWFMVCGLWFVV